MTAILDHLQLNVDARNFPFYRELFAVLGWSVIMDDQHMLAARSAGDTSIWCVAGAKEVVNDYDGPGVNHLGIGVTSRQDVDAVAAFIAAQDISPLFDTPRLRPDFSGEDGTYYQVMFTSEDGILFEVKYAG